MTIFFTRKVALSALLASLLGFGAAQSVSGHDCPDLNNDNMVNVIDLLAVINAWGPCPEEPAPCPENITDSQTGNSIVNVADLLEVIENWGQCPPP